MCSKYWKENPIFQNCFQTDLSLEKKIDDHIIRILELATTGTHDFPEFSRYQPYKILIIVNKLLQSINQSKIKLNLYYTIIQFTWHYYTIQLPFPSMSFVITGSYGSVKQVERKNSSSFGLRYDRKDVGELRYSGELPITTS